MALLFRLSQVCSFAKLAVKRIAERTRVGKRSRPYLAVWCLAYSSGVNLLPWT